MDVFLNNIDIGSAKELCEALNLNPHGDMEKIKSTLLLWFKNKDTEKISTENDRYYEFIEVLGDRFKSNQNREAAIEFARSIGVEPTNKRSSLYVYSRSGSFYRASKHACEMIIESYAETFGLSYTILRYGSLYGPRADEKNGIRAFITQALKEGKITRPGDGSELREYVHVCDAAKGSVTILAKEFECQSVILTGHQQMHVADLLQMIREMLGGKVAIEYIPAVNNYHYQITPYTFAPKIAKRLISSTYLDLGQGILDSIYQLARELDVDHQPKV